MRNESKPIKGFVRDNVLIIEYKKAPAKLKKLLGHYREEWYNGHIELFCSELMPGKNEDWGDTLTEENIRNWWLAYNKEYGEKLTFKQFIYLQSLDVEMWLIKSGYNFDGIKEILIKI